MKIICMKINTIFNKKKKKSHFIALYTAKFPHERTKKIHSLVMTNAKEKYRGRAHSLSKVIILAPVALLRSREFRSNVSLVSPLAK